MMSCDSEDALGQCFGQETMADNGVYLLLAVISVGQTFHVFHIEVR